MKRARASAAPAVRVTSRITTIGSVHLPPGGADRLDIVMASAGSSLLVTYYRYATPHDADDCTISFGQPEEFEAFLACLNATAEQARRDGILPERAG